MEDISVALRLKVSGRRSPHCPGPRFPCCVMAWSSFLQRACGVWCVPQRPCVRNWVSSVPVLRDGTFKEVIRSWWFCPQGWDGLMWFPWEWTVCHKNNFVPKVGSVSASFSRALPPVRVTGWCNKKALPRCQDLVFRCPGFWKGVR